MKNTKKIASAAIFMLVFAVLFCDKAYAAIPESTTSFYVNDYSGVMTNATKDYIISKNAILENEASGAQIVVATVNSTNGVSIDDYATAMFNKWEIGTKNANNGILLLLSIIEEDYFVIVGDGIDVTIGASNVVNIVIDAMEKDFAAGNFDDGIKKAFDDLYDAVYTVYYTTNGTEYYTTNGTESSNQIPNQTVNAETINNNENSSSNTLFFALIIVFIIFIFSRLRRTRYTSVPIPPRYNPWYKKRWHVPPHWQHFSHHKHNAHNKPPNNNWDRNNGGLFGGGGGSSRGAGGGRSSNGFGGGGRSSGGFGGGGRSSGGMGRGGGGSSRGAGGGRRK